MMDIDIDRDERELTSGAGPERLRERVRGAKRTELSAERELIREKNRAWRVSEREVATMRDIGQFRTIALQDLLRHRYNGDKAAFREDVTSLADQGLVQLRSGPSRNGRRQLDVLVLTPPAKRLLELHAGAENETFYTGFVKRSEVAHDAAIYRMFQAERIRIEGDGGKVRRTTLDYEFKRRAYAPLAKVKPTLTREAYAERQAEVAKQFRLAIVDGHLVLPDLRIEYMNARSEIVQIDLELATEHYHGSHLAAKAQAGFRFYAAEGAAEHLGRVLDDEGIVAEILSL